MKEKDSAKIPEKRGSDYVAIFVRQLGGAIVPSGSEETGTTVRVRFPLLLVPPGGAERPAASRVFRPIGDEVTAQFLESA
jgi:hypothetical protein